ncbi:MAG: sigma-70 family RNA polymerase sigma factor, partial [Solirubrobacteraceae bacterium]
LLLTQSDASLVAFARSGHERAFEALVQRYRRPLHNYCRRLLLSNERAEDALQQALLQAWLALRAGTEVNDVRPWLYRIVHNAAVNTLRVSGYDYCKLSESLSGAGAPHEDLDRRIAVREALAGLAALPEMQREALLRTAVEGRTHQQVAHDLGLSQNALRGLVYRARATLRAAAGAITPSPLVSWALGATRGTPVVERLAEFGVGGSSAGLAGLLTKGGAVAVTASVLAGGIVTGHHTHHQRATAKHASRLAPTPITVASVQPARWTAAVGTPKHGSSSPAHHPSPRAHPLRGHTHRGGPRLAMTTPAPLSNAWLHRSHRDDRGNSHNDGDAHKRGPRDSADAGRDFMHHDHTLEGRDSRDGKEGNSSALGGESHDGTSSSSTREHGGRDSGGGSGTGDTGSRDGHDGSNDRQTNAGSSESQATNEPSKDGQTAPDETVK